MYSGILYKPAITSTDQRAEKMKKVDKHVISSLFLAAICCGICLLLTDMRHLPAERSIVFPVESRSSRINTVTKGSYYLKTLRVGELGLNVDILNVSRQRNLDTNLDTLNLVSSSFICTIER